MKPTRRRVVAHVLCPDLCRGLLLAVGFSSLAGAGEAGKLLEERWTGISGEAVSLLTSHANFPNNPSLVQKITGVVPDNNVGDRYGRRLRGFITAPQSGHYKFWI
ncbi:MAG: hypothetical protein QM627_00135, partial [Luteolibacter sp.]